jgi:hypothetical protein
MIYRDLIPDAELKAFVQAMNARAKASNNGGRIDIPLLRDRILESGGRCEWCGVSVVGSAFEVDHIISLSQGGGNVAENLVVACPSCNRKKGEKHPARFAQEISRNAKTMTPFVTRILQIYDVPPAVQLSLFDDEDNM